MSFPSGRILMEINISIFKHFTQEQFLLYCIIVQLSLIDTCSSTNWHLKLMNTNFAVFIILKPILIKFDFSFSWKYDNVCPFGWKPDLWMNLYHYLRKNIASIVCNAHCAWNIPSVMEKNTQSVESYLGISKYRKFSGLKSLKTW